MSSQTQMQDQIIAQQLQTQELQHRRQSMDEQTRRDEELARRLTQESSPQRLTVGQSSTVRLHHPVTRRQIGETVLAHLVEQGTLRFELLHNGGKYLRVLRNGSVDFAPVVDDSTLFSLEMTSTGTMYLSCKALSNSNNNKRSSFFSSSKTTAATAAANSYLSMSLEGALSGNGNKTQLAQWVMVAADNNNNSSSTSSSGQPVSPTAAAAAAFTDSSSSSSSNNNNSLALNESDNILLQQPAAAPPRPAPNTAIAAAASRATAAIAASRAAAVDSYYGFPGVDAGKQQLMKFFATDAGIAFLQQPQLAAAYFLYLEQRSLEKILHRPDWPQLANNFVDFASHPPEFDLRCARSCASFDDIKSLFENGFVVLKGIVPLSNVDKASRVVNYWIAKHITATNINSNGGSSSSGSSGDGISKRPGQVIECTGAVCSDPDVLSLYYRSSLHHLVEHLLGPGDVNAVQRCCSILTAYPTLTLTLTTALNDDSSNSNSGSTSISGSQPVLLGDHWFVDGFTSTATAGTSTSNSNSDSGYSHSPYNLVLGVALTDVAESGQGNHCVHPGSHLMLLDMYKQQVLHKSTMFSDDPSSVRKPDLGPPVQLLLKRGDAFLCTQRLAYLRTTNTAGAVPSSIAYFKISHIDHDVLKDLALDDMWVEYKAAPYYLENASEEEAKRKTQAASAPAAFNPSFNTKMPSTAAASSATAATAAASVDELKPAEERGSIDSEQLLIDFDDAEEEPMKSLDAVAKSMHNDLLLLQSTSQPAVSTAAAEHKDNTVADDCKQQQQPQSAVGGDADYDHLWSTYCDPDVASAAAVNNSSNGGGATTSSFTATVGEKETISTAADSGLDDSNWSGTGSEWTLPSVPSHSLRSPAATTTTTTTKATTTSASVNQHQQQQKERSYEDGQEEAITITAVAVNGDDGSDTPVVTATTIF